MKDNNNNKQQTLEQAPATPTAQAQSENLPAQNKWAGQFTQEEITQAVDVAEGYVEKFSYFVYTDQNKFVVSKLIGQERKEIARHEKLLMTIVYAHQSYKLQKGAVRGEYNIDAWTDEDREIVASTMANPFFGEVKSRGNFDPRYSAWLDDKEKRQHIGKRQYIVAKIEGVCGVGELALISLGSSGMVSLNNYAKAISVQKLPIGFVVTEATLESAKNEAGKSYFKPTFSAAKDKAGQIASVFKDAAQYRAVIPKTIEIVKELHRQEVKRCEEKTTRTDATHGDGGFIDDAANMSAGAAAFDSFASDQDIPF